MTTTSTSAEIGTVFREHGIGIAIAAPIMQIQELALAISLNNRYRVSVAYYSQNHRIEATICERLGGMWVAQRTLGATLPTRDSDERQRQMTTQDLGSIADTLRQLLKEGPAS